VFGNRALNGLVGPWRDQARGAGENFIMRSFVIFTNNRILLTFTFGMG
jgi:hypothetical protein